MRNINVRLKMIIMAGISAFGMLLIISMALFSIMELDKISASRLSEAIRADYDQRIKEQVENASSMVDGVMAMAENGDATKDEALYFAARALRGIRYGEDGYFWADKIDGKNVVLLGKETEGTMRLHAKDADGFEFVSAIIKAAQRGGGYVDYKFAKEGGSVPLPKRAYSMVNEKTGWVIGTGNYVDDIDAFIEEQVTAMNKRIRFVAMILLASSIFMVVFTFLVARGISKSIIRALGTSFSYIEKMAGGDFTTEISEEMLERRDDFGMLAEKLEFLKVAVGKVIRDVKSMASTVEEKNDVVDSGFEKVKSDLDEICENIENLSSVFTETAASMDQFTEFAITVGKCTEELSEEMKRATEKILKLHKKVADDRTAVFKNGMVDLVNDRKASRDRQEYLHESEDYENYVDSVLSELETMSAELNEDMESLMSSIGQISDVSGQGAIGVESIEDSILAIRKKIEDLEKAFKDTEDMVFELDYEVAKFAVRND